MIIFPKTQLFNSFNQKDTPLSTGPSNEEKKRRGGRKHKNEKGNATKDTTRRNGQTFGHMSRVPELSHEDIETKTGIESVTTLPKRKSPGPMSSPLIAPNLNN